MTFEGAHPARDTTQGRWAAAAMTNGHGVRSAIPDLFESYLRVMPDEAVSPMPVACP
jgi:hypothetical protein